MAEAQRQAETMRQESLINLTAMRREAEPRRAAAIDAVVRLVLGQDDRDAG